MALTSLVDAAEPVVLDAVSFNALEEAAAAARRTPLPLAERPPARTLGGGC